MAGETCPYKRVSLAALSSSQAPHAADQVAILFASGAHAGFDQLAEAAARLRTQFPSLQYVVGTAVRIPRCDILATLAQLVEAAAQLQALFPLRQRTRGAAVRA